MKHAKQQFDKLRKQSYDRNVENDSLKAEVEELRASLAHTQTAATQQMVPLEELDEIRAQLRDAETEKSADRHRLENGISRFVMTGLRQRRRRQLWRVT